MYFASTGTEYLQSNADADRVRPTNFRTPALTSHQAFWILNPSQDQLRLQREQVRNALDEVILGIATRARLIDQEARIEPFVDDNNILFAHTSVNFLITNDHLDKNGKLDHEKLSPAQRTMVESDHRVVSLHFTKGGCPITIRFEMQTEYFTISTCAELAECSDQDLQRTIVSVQQAVHGTDVAAVREKLYDQFWKDLLDIDCLRLLQNSVFSEIFADFRGIVIINDGVLQGTQRDQRIERLLPLVMPLWFNKADLECSVGYMLGGRSLYMTCLGPQISEARSPSLAIGRIPVTYLLCVGSQTNRWERGRVTELIHGAGVSRLAALRDLAALRRVGGELAGMDHFTTGAQKAVSENPKNASAAIKIAHDRFGNVTTEFNVKTDTDYGILYRVERSRYYVARFRDAVTQMRIIRVAGHQPYDRFVLQRLGSAFDFIDRLGRRYERSVNTLALLDGYYLTIRSNEIAESQQATALEEKGINDSIERIQEYGEFILIGFLLPYYAVGLFAHIYEPGSDTGRDAVAYFTYIIWTAALALAWFLKRKVRLLRKLTEITLLTAILWGLVWAIYHMAPTLIDLIVQVIQRLWSIVQTTL